MRLKSCQIPNVLSWRATRVRNSRASLRLGIHGIARDMYILFVSGRVITVDEPSLCENVASVLPSLEQLGSQQKVNEVDSGSRVRHLLHRNPQSSTESSTLRARSSQLVVCLACPIEPNGPPAQNAALCFGSAATCESPGCVTDGELFSIVTSHFVCVGCRCGKCDHA